MPQRLIGYIPGWDDHGDLVSRVPVRVGSVGSTAPTSSSFYSATEWAAWFSDAYSRRPAPRFSWKTATLEAVQAGSLTAAAAAGINLLFYRRDNQRLAARMPKPHFGFRDLDSARWLDGDDNPLPFADIRFHQFGWFELHDENAVEIEAGASLPALGVGAELRDPADSMTVHIPLAFGVGAKLDTDTTAGLPDGATLPALTVGATLTMEGQIGAGVPLELDVGATLQQDAYEIAAGVPLELDVGANVTVELVPRPGVWHQQAVDVVAPTWTRRLWTGPVQATIGGNKYEAVGGADGTLIGLEPGESAIGPQGQRARGYIFVAPESFRRAIEQDLGPAAITIRWAISRDKGQTWSFLSELFVGRLSNGSIDLQTGIWSFDLETWHGDADRITTRRWSYDEQYRRASGDRGFEYMSELAAGVDIEWRI